MEPFDKLNQSFNVDESRQWRWWVPLVYFLTILFAVCFYWKLHQGITYVTDHGLKPSIIRLWEGPK